MVVEVRSQVCGVSVTREVTGRMLDLLRRSVQRQPQRQAEAAPAAQSAREQAGGRRQVKNAPEGRVPAGWKGGMKAILKRWEDPRGASNCYGPGWCRGGW